VIPNLKKDDVVSEVLQVPVETMDLEPLARQPLPGIHLRTRAFIKAQDGCDNFCTFCITRLARVRVAAFPRRMWQRIFSARWRAVQKKSC